MNTLSPLDSRYISQTEEIRKQINDYELDHNRVIVETQFAKFLLQKKIFDIPNSVDIGDIINKLTEIEKGYNENSYNRILEIEATTKHDVKAVEYYIREQLPSEVRDIVHIFLTSEDTNNLSYNLMLKSALDKALLPKIKTLLQVLSEFSKKYASNMIYAKTHGQTATPTTIGKEFRVVLHRLNRQFQKLENQEYLGKMNCSVGTFSAMNVAKPEVDWTEKTKKFVESLGLVYNPLTTQIESHDGFVELFSTLKHFNSIAHNFAQDVWLYISNEIFSQKQPKGSVGSSVMPHKINPIKFENAEANFEMSNGLLETFCNTLVTSRMQRDLSDSSIQRNIGLGLAHSYLALDNLISGLNSLEANPTTEVHPEVLTEAIQTIMRVTNLEGSTNFENPYDTLKGLARGKSITLPALKKFVKDLKLPINYENILLKLKPENYIGLAEQLAKL
jgi:adenylosuccinate lyase